MSCAPTTTVATPTMAAAAVPKDGTAAYEAACHACHGAGSMRAWLSSVLATKPLEAGHKPRIRLVGMLIVVPLP